MFIYFFITQFIVHGAESMIKPLIKNCDPAALAGGETSLHIAQHFAQRGSIARQCGAAWPAVG